MGDASPVSRRSTRHARRTHLDHSTGPLSMRILCASPRKRLSCQLFQPRPSCDFSYCAWPCGSCLACFCAASFRTYPSRLFLLAYFFSFLVRRKFGLRDPPKIYRLAAFQKRLPYVHPALSSSICLPGKPLCLVMWQLEIVQARNSQLGRE